MQSTAQILLALGGMLLLGLLTDMIGRRTFMPRVTLLLIFGVIIGDQVLNLIPDIISERFELIANIALLMVGFLLGGKLTAESLKRSGKQILSISISAAVVTTGIVMAGLLLVQVELQIAVILGCIAAATAPAASVDIVIESKIKNRFSKMLLAIVALDDAWGLILFSVSIAVVGTLNGINGSSSSVMIAFTDIGGAVLLGLCLGFPAAYLSGRIKPGQPMLTEALGLVFICGGLAVWMEVSYLIASMVMGAIVANFARHHEYPFHAIEGIEWPFMVIFFVLAGASLEFDALQHLGLIGAVYVISRITGKILGGKLGGLMSHADPRSQNWIGLAMMPQAGAALGMALVAAHQFPEYRQSLLSIVISTTVFFEILGPVFTRLALKRSQLKYNTG